MKSAVTRKLFQPLCNYAVVTASLGVRPNVYQKKKNTEKENQYIGSKLCKNINSEIKPIRLTYTAYLQNRYTAKIGRHSSEVAKKL